MSPTACQLSPTFPHFPPPFPTFPHFCPTRREPNFPTFPHFFPTVGTLALYGPPRRARESGPREPSTACALRPSLLEDPCDWAVAGVSPQQTRRCHPPVRVRDLPPIASVLRPQSVHAAVRDLQTLQCTDAQNILQASTHRSNSRLSTSSSTCSPLWCRCSEGCTRRLLWDPCSSQPAHQYRCQAKETNSNVTAHPNAAFTHCCTP